MTATLAPRADVVVAPRPSSRRTVGSAVRPIDRRPMVSERAGTACSGESRLTGSRRDAQAAVFRRRRGVAAVLVGSALAVLVWFFAIVGGNYEASTTPQPSSSSVSYVRSGDSLSSVASRVAPQMPQQTVIADIMALNKLESSGLTVGQALVTPVY